MTIVITFYDEIRPGDAEEVLAKLRADPAADVEVRINSPGGSVAEGLAIYNSLKPRRPLVHIDGIAASIASLIAMAGSRIFATENALVMIHDPWTPAASGNASELRRTADLLDKHRDAMVGGYARTGLAHDQLLELLADETWMTSSEALQLGFVDEIVESMRYAAHAPECFSGYLNTPKELIMFPSRTARAAGAPPAKPDETQEPAPALDPALLDPKKALEAFKKGLSSDKVTQAAHDAVLEALRERNEEIAAMAKAYMGNPRVRDYTIAALADPAVSVADYGQKILSMLAVGVEPISGGYHAAGVGTRGGSGDFVQAASDALAIRAGIQIAKPHPGARDVQSMGLGEIVRACISRSGRSFDIGSGSNASLIRAAMSTSDFPAILENTLGKALRGGFETEPSTHNAWTRQVLVPDYKPQSRVLLGSAPELLPIAEGAEYTFGALDEDKSVPYSVGRFGRLVRFTEEALVNDDLGAFVRMTQALGQAAARAEADKVYATFADNAFAGSTMQDGAPLFHASHGNLTGVFAGIDASSLSAARILLRRQVALGGGVMNLTPRYLLVAPEHEQAAEALLAAAARSMSQGADNALVPAWLAKLELVVEARLTDDAFYLLTGPDSVDTLERAWLEADNGPKIAEEDSFGVDARTYKVRHVFGVRWLDWRGAVKVPLTA